MNKKRLLTTLAATSLVVLTLVGCGKSANNDNNVKKVSLPSEYKNTKPAIKGGTLRTAYVTDSAFKGVFNEELYNDAYDADVMRFGSEDLFATDANYKYTKGGAADISFDRKNNTATVTINPKVKWSDGQPLTAQDYEYAYKIIANKESKSSRYTDSLQNLKGLKEYHEGKTDNISGFQIVNDHKVILHFKEIKPGMYTSGNGFIWENAAPYHYLKDVPFSKLVSSDQVRKHPLFFGPYKLTKLVQGESAEWAPNEYYYKGKPKLDKITIETVSTSSASAALKAKKYDILFEEPASVYGQNRNPKGYKMLGSEDLYYSYLGFNVGHFDEKTGENVMDKNTKVSNRKLRQALGYAMNVDQVAKKFGYGLSYRATTLIPTAFKEYHDKDAKGFPQDLDKANKLLDEAGYKKGKDGYRKTPEGKKLTLTLLAMGGSANTEASVRNYIQQWKKVGVRVKLYNGRFVDFNNFYDIIQGGSKKYDMYMAAWGVSSEPSPNDLYSKNAPYNYTHFVSAENTKLLNNINSTKAFDNSYRKEQFNKWQEYMNKEAYVIPIFNKYQPVPVSTKVKGMHLTPDSSKFNWNQVELTK